jgi:F0F1-type ATP synthase membrane subunit b/b'
VDVHDKFDEIVRLVEDARAMPMSASALVNRAEVLELLAQLADLMPEQLDQADLLLADREAVVEQGRAEAARIVEDARSERDRLVEETEVVRAARERAAEVERAAQTESERLLSEADDYVDRKLGEFEIVLDKLTAQVRRGREHLAARLDQPQPDGLDDRDESPGAVT